MHPAGRLGVGKRLLSEILAHSRTSCEEVSLTVVAGNEAARHLYAAAGLMEYGCEPRAIKIDAEYFDELLMRLRLSSPA